MTNMNEDDGGGVLSPGSDGQDLESCSHVFYSLRSPIPRDCSAEVPGEKECGTEGEGTEREHARLEFKCVDSIRDRARRVADIQIGAWCTTARFAAPPSRPSVLASSWRRYHKLNEA